MTQAAATVDNFGQPAEAASLAGVHVLKYGNLFLLSDETGDVIAGGNGLGLYAEDTRFISNYRLLVEGHRPGVLLPAPAAATSASIWLTNPDRKHLPAQSVGLTRHRQIDASLVEQLHVNNYLDRPIELALTLEVGADFADIFEVRGMHRPQPGELLEPAGDGGRLEFAYRGLDERTYRTTISLAPAWQLGDRGHGQATLRRELGLGPAEAAQLRIEIEREIVPAARPRRRPLVDPAATRSTEPVKAALAEWETAATVATSHPGVASTLDRARADLQLLINSGPAAGQRYLAGGIPWFSCLFGRDSLVSAMQLLPINPSIARDALIVLASLQATGADEWRDAQPGKIPHELRAGELSTSDTVPFAPYYGTIDATPLWLMLLARYHHWTADDELLDRLWPNALAALGWLDASSDEDGFIAYQRRSSRGLDNQGWKDSWDAIRMRDGRIAPAPIALVEVQAYAYAARRGIAQLAARRGESALAEAQAAAAERLRARFEDAFWMPSAGTYALALDGDGAQVDALASNAGHVLWTGIASREHAASVADVLTGPQMWSGWGVRTLAATTGGYNPIGYHTGSVWPHDSAISAAGMAEYGLSAAAAMVAGGVFEASGHFDQSRLPELYGGFERAESNQPVPYPVACSPQAWAAGTPFQLVGALLGLAADAPGRRLTLRPRLPEWLPDLSLHGLRIGDAAVDVLVRRSNGGVDVDVKRKRGDLDVIVHAE